MDLLCRVHSEIPIGQSYLVLFIAHKSKALQYSGRLCCRFTDEGDNLNSSEC